MDMENALGETLDELHRVDALPDQMAGIQCESKLGGAVHGLDHRFGTPQVEGHLPGMSFQGIAHTQFAQLGQDRAETPAKIGQSLAQFSVTEPGVSSDARPDG